MERDRGIIFVLDRENVRDAEKINENLSAASL